MNLEVELKLAKNELSSLVARCKELIADGVIEDSSTGYFDENKTYCGPCLDNNIYLIARLAKDIQKVLENNKF